MGILWRYLYTYVVQLMRTAFSSVNNYILADNANVRKTWIP